MTERRRPGIARARRDGWQPIEKSCRCIAIRTGSETKPRDASASWLVSAKEVSWLLWGDSNSCRSEQRNAIGIPSHLSLPPCRYPTLSLSRDHRAPSLIENGRNDQRQDEY